MYIFFVALFVLLLLDTVYYIKAVNKYGPRYNWLPLSGFYEWFVKKGG